MSAYQELKAIYLAQQPIRIDGLTIPVRSQAITVPVDRWLEALGDRRIGQDFEAMPRPQTAGRRSVEINGAWLEAVIRAIREA